MKHRLLCGLALGFGLFTQGLFGVVDVTEKSVKAEKDAFVKAYNGDKPIKEYKTAEFKAAEQEKLDAYKAEKIKLDEKKRVGALSDEDVAFEKDLSTVIAQKEFFFADEAWVLAVDTFNLPEADRQRAADTVVAAAEKVNATDGGTVYTELIVTALEKDLSAGKKGITDSGGSTTTALTTPSAIVNATRASIQSAGDVLNSTASDDEVSALSADWLAEAAEKGVALGQAAKDNSSLANAAAQALKTISSTAKKVVSSLVTKVTTESNKVVTSLSTAISDASSGFSALADSLKGTASDKKNSVPFGLKKSGADISVMKRATEDIPLFSGGLRKDIVTTLKKLRSDNTVGLDASDSSVSTFVTGAKAGVKEMADKLKWLTTVLGSIEDNEAIIKEALTEYEGNKEEQDLYKMALQQQQDLAGVKRKLADFIDNFKTSKESLNEITDLL